MPTTTQSSPQPTGKSSRFAVLLGQIPPETRTAADACRPLCALCVLELKLEQAVYWDARLWHRGCWERRTRGGYREEGS